MLLKIIYPKLSDFIEKIPKKTGTILSWCFIVFMSINIIISGLAIQRYSERQNGQISAQNPVEEFLDQHYPNERMERIYPNAKFPQKKIKSLKKVKATDHKYLDLTFLKHKNHLFHIS